MLAAQACSGAKSATACPSPWLPAVHPKVQARSVNACPHLSNPLPPPLATCTLAPDLHHTQMVKSRSHARLLRRHERVRQDL